MSQGNTRHKLIRVNPRLPRFDGGVSHHDRRERPDASAVTR